VYRVLEATVAYATLICTFYYYYYYFILSGCCLAVVTLPLLVLTPLPLPSLPSILLQTGFFLVKLEVGPLECCELPAGPGRAQSPISICCILGQSLYILALCFTIFKLNTVAKIISQRLDHDLSYS